MIILVVDDKEDNRYLLEVLFKGQGNEVLSAVNGAEALEFLKSRDVSLIITDILMPVMDGFELCRKVKSNEKLRRIPLIIYTATYTGPQDEAFAMKIGASRFIQKPCDPDVLMTAVSEVIASAERDPAASDAPPAVETEVLKLYNERLVRKLEQKMLQLEGEVHARQNAEVILRQSEERYRSLFNSIRDAILVSDINRRIVDCNPAFIDLFGYSLKDVMGKKTRVLYEKEEDFNQFGDALRKISGDEGFFQTFNFIKKDGAVFPAEAHVYLLRNDVGDYTGLIGMIRDVTERKRAEKTQNDLQFQLMQAQKMESVGRLAGGVAHDFNNLLSIIMGYGEIVRDALGVKHSCRGALDNLLSASTRARDLTRQLLAFSRKQVLEMKAVDVNQVVKGFEKLLRRLIGEDIELILSLTSEACVVKADTSQLEQVLMNIAVNARDAMPSGGALTMETARVTVDSVYAESKPDLLPGDYILITVSDTGCGMDKATLEHIYEPFFTTKGKDKGTGLGLATTYGIIKQHGGFIWAYSEPGEGTAFKIYLPLNTREEVSDVRPMEVLPSVPDTITALIVEDESMIRQLLSRILKENGFIVIESVDVDDAIEKARCYQSPIHLVLTDVIMPGMKGPEVFEKIKAHHPQAKVIFMSGYTDEMIVRYGVLKEGISFIQKPFTAKELLVKCYQALQD